MAPSLPKTIDPERVFEVSRTFNVRPDVMFQMWTDPAHLVHWCQPGGFDPCVIEAQDLRPGGLLKIRMPHKEGVVYDSHWTYQEISPPRCLRYRERCYQGGTLFHDADMIVSLDAVGDQTRLTIRGVMNWVEGRDARWTPEAMRQGWTQGWHDNFALLERHLATL
jgi:uncharacterized protein YndB with AHSA1/START domain